MGMAEYSMSPSSEPATATRMHTEAAAGARRGGRAMSTSVTSTTSSPSSLLGLTLIQVLSDDKHYSPFICTLCQNLVSLDCVVTTECSHPFCRSCLEEWVMECAMDKRDCHCPTCQVVDLLECNHPYFSASQRQLQQKQQEEEQEAAEEKDHEDRYQQEQDDHTNPQSSSLSSEAAAATSTSKPQETSSTSTAATATTTTTTRTASERSATLRPPLSPTSVLEKWFTMEMGSTRIAARPLEEVQPLAYKVLAQVQVACLTLSPPASSGNGGGGSMALDMRMMPNCEWSGNYGEYHDHTQTHQHPQNDVDGHEQQQQQQKLYHDRPSLDSGARQSSGYSSNWDGSLDRSTSFSRSCSLRSTLSDTKAITNNNSATHTNGLDGGGGSGGLLTKPSLPRPSLSGFKSRSLPSIYQVARHYGIDSDDDDDSNDDEDGNVSHKPDDPQNQHQHHHTAAGNDDSYFSPSSPIGRADRALPYRKVKSLRNLSTRDETVVDVAPTLKKRCQSPPPSFVNGSSNGLSVGAAAVARGDSFAAGGGDNNEDEDVCVNSPAWSPKRTLPGMTEQQFFFRQSPKPFHFKNKKKNNMNSVGSNGSSSNKEEEEGKTATLNANEHKNNFTLTRSNSKKNVFDEKLPLFNAPRWVSNASIYSSPETAKTLSAPTNPAMYVPSDTTAAAAPPQPPLQQQQQQPVPTQQTPGCSIASTSTNVNGAGGAGGLIAAPSPGNALTRDTPPNLVKRTKSDDSNKFALPANLKTKRPDRSLKQQQQQRKLSSTSSAATTLNGFKHEGADNAADGKHPDSPVDHGSSNVDLENSYSIAMDWNMSINSLGGWNDSYKETVPHMETVAEDEEDGAGFELQFEPEDEGAAAASALASPHQDLVTQQQRQEEEAKQAAEKRKKFMEHAEKLKKQANAKFNKGDFAEARVLYTEGITTMANVTVSSRSERELMSNMHSNRAVTFFREKKFESCIQDCDKAIGFDESYEKSWIRKWRALMALGNVEEAYSCLELASLTAPDSRRILEELGRAREEKELLSLVRNTMESGDLQKARDILKPHSRSSDNIGLLFLAAKIDAGLGLTESALEKANKALRFNPGHTEGLGLRGYILFLSGETEKGAHLLQDAYSRNKENKKIRLELTRCQKTHSAFAKGRASVKRGRYADAVEHFSNAIKESGPVPGKAILFGLLRTERAEALLLSKRYHEALKDCDEVISAQGENATAWTVRSEILICLGKVEEAKQELDEIRRTWGSDNPTIDEGYRRVDFELRVLKADEELMGFVNELEFGRLDVLNMSLNCSALPAENKSPDRRRAGRRHETEKKERARSKDPDDRRYRESSKSVERSRGHSHSRQKSGGGNVYTSTVVEDIVLDPNDVGGGDRKTREGRRRPTLERNNGGSDGDVARRHRRSKSAGRRRRDVREEK